MKKIAVLLSHSPFDGAISREAHDMIMALAAVEHQVTVIYQEAAVLQLLPVHSAAMLGCKDYTPAQKLFELYEVAAVVASACALQRYQMLPEQCLIAVTAMADPDIQALLAQQQQILRF
ncbi:sulfurtransferase complex subunit TusC [Rheinheimera riviphila]|uniref:Sulfurtransferase complex subunit TusC n=1 Tax=Rheinheimera riviphila TaxID=1834037 RepID=A0A437R2B7_9GAMM|nr:DsrE family protein [Rheinheimera riviphila]RVU40817.1 sulfurtransferase complex subunit TusC [Rheinheimera riviphila]